jgi:signal peptidase I
MLLVVLASVAALNTWNSGSLKLLSVDSGSMAPTVAEGDAVVIRSVNPLDISKDDIISYRSPEDASLIITHRVLLVDPLTGQLITKGDANSSLDPTFSSSEIVGRVAYIIPGAGHLVDVLHSWVGLVLVVYLPAAILLGSELWRLSKYYLRPTYVLHHRRY